MTKKKLKKQIKQLKRTIRLLRFLTKLEDYNYEPSGKYIKGRWDKRKEALEPEFIPANGKLYMVFTHASGPPMPLIWDRQDLDYFHLVRPLTEQEWIDIGAPITEARDE